MKTTLLPILMLVLIVCACPGQEPQVRVSLAVRDDVWVGQRVVLVVELLAPGYFSGAPTFDLPNVSGLLLAPPTDRPVLSNETIGDVSYTIQRHELSVFARKAGDQVIPSFRVRFQFKSHPLDKEPVAATVSTQPVHFSAKSPPGAEGLGNIISARHLLAKETWQPQPGKTMAGTAFTRTIEFSAPDVPGMALPPFPVGRIDGLGIYPKPPEVLDESERGDLLGRRRDMVTYVCQRPGQYVIPAVRFTWFDLDAHQLRTITFPAVKLEVIPNPAMAAAAPQEQMAPVEYSTGFWIGIAAVVLILAALLFPERGWAWVCAPLRPVHLVPLNPVGQPVGHTTNAVLPGFKIPKPSATP